MYHAGLHKPRPKRVKNKRKKTIEEMREIFKEKGYELISNEYINNETHLEYICPKHRDKGVQKITYGKLSIGRGCYYCGRESQAKTQTHSYEYVKNVIENEYKEDCCTLISKEYTRYNDYNLKIQCKCGRSFTTSLEIFKICKRSCDVCKQSIGANKVQSFLEDNNFVFSKEQEFNGLLSDMGNPLRYDFSILDAKNKPKINLEFDGEFHFRKFYEEQDLEKQQYHDKLKNEYCIKHNIPLIRIPYWERDNIESILTDILINENYDSKFIINN